MRYVEMTRREFLAAGAAAVGGLAVGAGSTWGETNLFGISQDSLKFSYVGLFPIEESGPRNGRLLQRIVNPPGEYSECPIPMMENANFFPQGDREFLDRGLRLSVWGFIPKDIEDTPDAIDVEVLYEPFHSNRFRAWSFRKRPVWTEQSPSRLCVPIDEGNGLNLNVSMRWGHTMDHEQNPPSQREWNGTIRLVVGSDTRAPKLMRGIYAIPLSARGGYELKRFSEGQPLAQARAPFLLLETEYGDRHADLVA
jgi:hypothetical protein